MAGRGLGTLTLDLVTRIGGFTGPLDKAGRELDKRTRQMQKTAEKFGRDLGVALKVGFGVAAAGLSIYVKNTIEAEKVQAQLAARIKDTAGVAGRSLKELNAQAERLQGLTIFDDEQIGEAQAALLTFTQVTGREFDRTIELATDLATVLGTDVPAAAKILGKALSDPEKGMTALKRAGVTLTEDQKALVKQFQETGDIAAAQGVILDALAGKMGSAAEAARDTLGGALQGLQNAFNNLLEGDGGSAGVREATEAVNDFSASLNSSEARQNMDALISALVKVAGFVGSLVDAFIKAGQQIGNVMGFIGRSAADIVAGNQALLRGDLAGARAAQQKFLGEYKNFVQETKRTRGDFNKAAGVPLNSAGVNTPGGRIEFIDPPRPKREDGAAARAEAADKAGAAAARENAAAKREAADAAREQAERERELEESVRKAAEAQADFNRQLEDLTAQVGGPLAESQLRYRREEEALRKQWAEGSTPEAEKLTEALRLLHIERDKDAEAIRKSLDTGEQHLEQLRNELELLQLTSQAERDRAAFLLDNPTATGAQADQAAAISRQIDETRKAIQAADDVRLAFEDAFVNVFTDGISAVDGFFKTIFQQLLLLEAKKASMALFGEPGTSGGGLIGGLFGAFFGGGSTPAAAAGPTGFLSAFGGSFANGTDFAPGGMSLVGERGPEIVNLPRGASVTPNHKLGGTTINVNVQPTTDRRTAQQIANEVSRKLAFSTRGGR